MYMHNHCYDNYLFNIFLKQQFLFITIAPLQYYIFKNQWRIQGLNFFGGVSKTTKSTKIG